MRIYLIHLIILISLITAISIKAQAQTSTGKPTNTENVPVETTNGETPQDDTVTIKRSTFTACRDAFARVPALEQSLSDALAAKTVLEMTVARMEKEKADLAANQAKTDEQKRIEIESLRKMILDLAKVASKGTRICFICK